MQPQNSDSDLLITAPITLDTEGYKWLSETNHFLYRTMVYPLIDEQLFLPIYSQTPSRPATSPKILMMLLILQAEYGKNRKDLLETFRFDLRWQLATNTLGMSYGLIPSCDSQLYRFEKRCQQYASEYGVVNPINRNYEIINAYCCALSGIDCSILRADSTPVSGNFTILSREELVYAAIQKGVDFLVAFGEQEQINAISNGRLSKYRDVVFTLNVFSYRWLASCDQKRSMLCQDADEFLKILHPSDTEDFNMQCYVRIINEQTKIIEGKRVFAEKGDEQLNSSIIQSIYDADATFRIKDNKKLWGYMLNSLEATNALSHMTIMSCLFPNKTSDANMMNDCFSKLPEFNERLNLIYAKYTALAKGDPFACQSLIQSILKTMKNDFIKEGNMLYSMQRNSVSFNEVQTQQKKLLGILDSFYPRLASMKPHTSKKIASGTNGESDASPPRKTEPPGKKGDGSLNGCCSRSTTDWAHYKEEQIDWTSDSFALLPDGVRRNYYLGKIAMMDEYTFELPSNVKICIADGAYSPCKEDVQKAGYILFTTNALGKKASPIIALFKIDIEGNYICPKNHPAIKQSTRSNGTICVWIDGSFCGKCTCVNDCRAKSAKKSGLYTVMINPHAIPAIISEAQILTDDYQNLANIRNGAESTASYYKNYHICDKWPIGLEIKRKLEKRMIVSCNTKMLILFARGETRVHPNKIYESQ